MNAHKLPKLDAANLKPDDLLSVSQLAKLCPGVSEANHCHRMTVQRWARKGVKVGGRQVKLNVIRTPGGQRLIRWGDYLAFRSECDRLRGEGAYAPIESPAERKRRTEAALREYERTMAEAKRQRKPS